ncbi:DUF1127 domain-containing protein [Xanthobacter autotrophicus]|uniref:DUF1127 domain-containing protein n=1 Tax=Xanthobacter autotrophicus TaxID=280 RepID=UPI003726771A
MLQCMIRYLAMQQRGVSKRRKSRKQRDASAKWRRPMLLWGFLARQFRRWQTYNRTVTELSKLDDRSLADINVSRSEIRALARHASAAV